MFHPSHRPFPKDFLLETGKSILLTVKEMFAVLHALDTWLPHFAGCRLVIYGDNTGVVQGLKHSSIEGPAMSPLGDIVMIFAIHDIVIESNWIPSKDFFFSRCTIKRSERKID